MAEETEILELKFEGGGVNPSTVKPHEIADLIRSFEDALLFTIKENNSEIDTDQLLFSFEDIKNESLGLRFIPKKIVGIVISSYISISTCLNSGLFHTLNNDTLKALKIFTKFTKKHNCVGYLKRNGETLSTLTPTTEIPINKNILIKGETTIFGTLIDVGGNNPNVHLRINDEYELIFDITLEKAKQLANKLYEKVSLNGTAKWDAENLKIVDFKLNEISDYTPSSTYEAIKKLRKLTNGYWNKFNTNDEINKELYRE